MIDIKKVVMGIKTHETQNSFSAMQSICVENSSQKSTTPSCQNLSKHLESFDFFFFLSCSYWGGLEEILKRPFEMDQSW